MAVAQFGCDSVHVNRAKELISSSGVLRREAKSSRLRRAGVLTLIISCLGALVMAAPARADAIVSTITGFDEPRGVAVLPDGTAAYVVNRHVTSPATAPSISKIRTSDNTIIATISLTGYNNPVGIAVTPDGSKLYVDANNGTTDALVEISTATDTVTGFIPTAALTGKEGLSVNPAGTRAYVAMGTGGVAVMDLTTNPVTRLRLILTGTGKYYSATTVSNDGTKLFVTNATEGSVLVLNATSTPEALITTFTGFVNPSAIAMTPDGSQIHVANMSNTGSVSILDSTTYALISTVTGFNRPAGIAFTPNGEQAYVTNSNNTIVAGQAAPYSVSVTSRSYQISFDGNGFTSGTVPSSGTFTTGGSAFTVPDNTGALAIAGYTFNGWNTRAGGTGTSYGPRTANLTYSAAANNTLFAQWTANQYSITFSGNGASTGSPPGAGTYTTGGTAYAVPGNTGVLDNPGYSFAGWNTRADGTGTAYGPGTANTTYSGLAALPLFAKWTAGTFPITFNPNGALSGVVPNSGSYTTGGPAYQVPGNDGNLEREGYAFGGWNTRADGAGTTYGPDAIDTDYAQGAPLPLFAIWNSLEIPIDNTIWYQSYGRATADVECASGYTASWAQWPNDRRGGYVCNAAVYAYHPGDLVTGYRQLHRSRMASDSMTSEATTPPRSRVR